MSTRPVYPFVLSVLFTLFPAFCLVNWLIFDPTLFQDIPFLAFTVPFVFTGLIGLVFRKPWALWLHLVLWMVCLLFTFYGWFSDVRMEKTYFPRYWWLYKQLFFYFSASFLSCWFGLLTWT